MSCTGPWPSRVKQVVVRNLLRALGFRYDIVPNGQEALAAVQRGGYDWVLTDVSMSVIDGYATSRVIRRWEAAMLRPSAAPSSL